MARLTFQQARLIPIEELAYRLGAIYSHEKGHDLWVKPSWRPEENSASCKIDRRRNKFIDFGPGGKGEGDIVDYWCDHHKKDRKDRYATAEARDALCSLGTIPQAERRTSGAEKEPRTPSDAFKLLGEPTTISKKTLNLVEEAERRKIPLNFVQKLLQQQYVLHRGKDIKFYAFGQKNLSGGTEISTFNKRTGKSFKCCIGTKDIDVMEPLDPQTGRFDAFVFNGRWDRITWLYGAGRQANAFYLNTNGDRLVGRAAEYLLARKEGLENVYFFKDHDHNGDSDRAEADFFTALADTDIRCGSLAGIYDGYKDLSDMQMQNEGGLRTAIATLKQKGYVPDPGHTAFTMVQNRPQRPR